MALIPGSGLKKWIKSAAGRAAESYSSRFKKNLNKWGSMFSSKSKDKQWDVKGSNGREHWGKY